MSVTLPTGSFGSWTVTKLKDSLISALAGDDRADGAKLRFYFYAVTLSGWNQLRDSVRTWLECDDGRSACAYVGTDHAITDPAGLEEMAKDGVAVRLMRDYRGAFHPKVVWLERAHESCVWAGSNNITRDGLVNNIEFAVAIRSAEVPHDLRCWANAVHAASVELTDENLQSYRNQRDKFERQRMQAKAMTFVWHARGGSHGLDDPRIISAGDLVLEVMPCETGTGGKQIQLPMAAVRDFFRVGDTKTITLTERNIPRSRRELTMTVYRNNTARLVIQELEYRDRPCVILFHRVGPDQYEFEIVRESVVPRQYRRLIKDHCNRKSRSGARRWGIVKDEDGNEASLRT